MTDIVSNWPFDTVVPTEDEPVYDILRTFENQLDRIDVQADELMEQRFVNTATTHELEKLGEEVGIVKQTGESESHYRFRAQLGKAISNSNGTMKDVAQILHLAFDDAVDDIEVTPKSDKPATQVTVPSAEMDDIPLTTSELAEMLTEAVPIGDTVDVVTSDTFVLGQSGDQGLGEGELV